MGLTTEMLDTKIRLLPGRRGAICCVQIEDRGDGQAQIYRRCLCPAKQRRAADAHLVRKLLKRRGRTHAGSAWRADDQASGGSASASCVYAKKVLVISGQLWRILPMVLDGKDAQHYDKRGNECIDFPREKPHNKYVVFGSAFVCDLLVFLKQLAPHSRVNHHTPRASSVRKSRPRRSPIGRGRKPSLEVCAEMKHKERPALADNSAKNNWETVRDTSQRCNVSARHLRGLMQSGAIPWYRVGKRRIVLDPVEVDLDPVG